MNKEEKQFLKSQEEALIRLANAVEAQYNRKPEMPPIMFVCWCDWCGKDTVHVSLLPKPDSPAIFPVASTTIMFNPPAKPLHICLACGNIQYKAD